MQSMCLTVKLLNTLACLTVAHWHYLSDVTGYGGQGAEEVMQKIKRGQRHLKGALNRPVRTLRVCKKQRNTLLSYYSALNQYKLVQLVVSQNFNASSKSHERRVDIPGLLESVSCSQSFRTAFRAGQITQRKPVKSEQVHNRNQLLEIY